MKAPPLPRRSHTVAWLAALVLVLRLALPGLPMPAATPGVDAALIRLLGEVPICHSGTGAVPAGQQPSGKPVTPAQDCALCPVCQLASAPALLPEAAWVRASQRVGNAGTALPPPSTGPPQHERYAARPRGPPASAV